jgi:hypothetical protein
LSRSVSSDQRNVLIWHCLFIIAEACRNPANGAVRRMTPILSDRSQPAGRSAASIHLWIGVQQGPLQRGDRRRQGTSHSDGSRAIVRVRDLSSGEAATWPPCALHRVLTSPCLSNSRPGSRRSPAGPASQTPCRAEWAWSARQGPGPAVHATSPDDGVACRRRLT